MRSTRDAGSFPPSPSQNSPKTQIRPKQSVTKLRASEAWGPRFPTSSLSSRWRARGRVCQERSWNVQGHPNRGSGVPGPKEKSMRVGYPQVWRSHLAWGSDIPGEEMRDQGPGPRGQPHRGPLLLRRSGPKRLGGRWTLGPWYSPPPLTELTLSPRGTCLSSYPTFYPGAGLDGAAPSSILSVPTSGACEPIQSPLLPSTRSDQARQAAHTRPPGTRPGWLPPRLPQRPPQGPARSRCLRNTCKYRRNPLACKMAPASFLLTLLLLCPSQLATF